MRRIYLPRDHTRVQYFPQCTSISGTLTGLLQRIWSSISGTIFPGGKYSTLRALWKIKIKHSSALSSCMVSYNNIIFQGSRAHYVYHDKQSKVWHLILYGFIQQVPCAHQTCISCFQTWPIVVNYACCQGYSLVDTLQSLSCSAVQYRNIEDCCW